MMNEVDSPEVESLEPAKIRTVAAWPVSLFVVVQLLLVTAGGGWAAARYLEFRHERELPEFRTEPLVVRPLKNDRQLVSDSDLDAVLKRLEPRLRGAHPRINFADHALRFWGVGATFQDSACLSGMELRELLLDHRVFSTAWGTESSPLLLTNKHGVAVRTADGEASASHVDHTLAGLAEVGTPLDFPVLTPEGERQVRDMLMQAVKSFSLNQVEYEWSALAFALYFQSGDPWMTTEGQRIDFNTLAERIQRQRLAQGVCSGMHRLHALVMLLRIDEEQHRLLTPEMRAQVIRHLKDCGERLARTQSEEGFWDVDWPGDEAEGPTPPLRGPLNPLADRLLVTGHVLEWAALAPEEATPPRASLERASRWLVSSIKSLSDGQIASYYPFLTHGGRGLALWRGIEAGERSSGRVTPEGSTASRSF